VHEAIVRAAERGKVDDDRLGAWLTLVTMRLCVDRFRQVSRETEAHARSVLAAPVQATVEEAVCDRAEAKWLAARSTDLPPHQEEVLSLRAQGLDLGQIAQRTGLSYQAVRSLLARARRALRATLATTLAIAVWLWRGRPRAAGGGAQTVTLVSAAVTLAIAGLSLVAPSPAEAEKAPGPRLRPYDTPLPADPPRASQKLRSPAPYELPPSVLPAAAGFGPVLPTDQGTGDPSTGAGPALPSPPSAAPSAPQGSPLPALPALPEAPDPALPTAPDVSAVVPPAPPVPAQPVELDSALAGIPGGLPTADAPLLQR
jgi:RNA polymerase sigma factor (sigma-70 family)